MVTAFAILAMFLLFTAQCLISHGTFVTFVIDRTQFKNGNLKQMDPKTVQMPNAEMGFPIK